jgi:hypothetical protein
MLWLAGRYKNFFVDTSALTLPNRVVALFKLGRYPEIFDRLIFGTDYPLPCLAYPCFARLAWTDFRRARSASNRFDRQFLVLQAFGISIGTDFATLIRQRKRL